MKKAAMTAIAKSAMDRRYVFFVDMFFPDNQRRTCNHRYQSVPAMPG